MLDRAIGDALRPNEERILIRLQMGMQPRRLTGLASLIERRYVVRRDGRWEITDLGRWRQSRERRRRWNESCARGRV